MHLRLLKDRTHYCDHVADMHQPTDAIARVEAIRTCSLHIEKLRRVDTGLDRFQWKLAHRSKQLGLTNLDAIDQHAASLDAHLIAFDSRHPLEERLPGEAREMPGRGAAERIDDIVATCDHACSPLDDG